MNILPDYGYPFYLDDLDANLESRHAWFYDATHNDIMLKPITMIEETSGPMVVIEINGANMTVPSNWHIMVIDPETKVVDTVSILNGSSGHHALLIHPFSNTYKYAPINPKNLIQGSCAHLSFPKHNMSLVPIGDLTDKLPACCLLCPNDIGNVLGDLSVQEILF